MTIRITVVHIKKTVHVNNKLLAHAQRRTHAECVKTTMR
jgi:hypothetical protein